MNRAPKYLAICLSTVVLLSGCALLGPPYAPGSGIDAYREELSDIGRRVDTGRWIELRPAGYEDSEVPAGIVFYPGGKVEPEAYLPLLLPFVGEGYLVTLVRMPLDLAVLDVDRGLEVLEAHTDVQRWHIAGHSLGGAMAAGLVNRAGENFATLTLLASYPAGSVDLSDREIPVLSVYASNDEVADSEQILEARAQYPPDARFVQIDGGNHAGFGLYGPQEGDGSREISREDQWRQTREAMRALFER
jgi:pimeloyl-ACP methyl ester carboxylesterase